MEHGQEASAPAPGASLFATLLAAFKASLHRLSGQADLVVGIPAAGQSVGGHDGLVGHCVNLCRCGLARARRTPFRELLKAVRTTMLDAYEHQQLHLRHLLQKLPIRPRPEPPAPGQRDLQHRPGPARGSAMAFDGLAVEFAQQPAALRELRPVRERAWRRTRACVLECQYNTDLFDPATVRRFMASYEVLLRGW